MNNLKEKLDNIDNLKKKIDNFKLIMNLILMQNGYTPIIIKNFIKNNFNKFSCHFFINPYSDIFNGFLKC